MLGGVSYRFAGGTLVFYVIADIKEILIVHVHQFLEILETFIADALFLTINDFFGFLDLFILQCSEVNFVLDVVFHVLRDLLSLFPRFL